MPDERDKGNTLMPIEKKHREIWNLELGILKNAVKSDIK